MKNVNPSASPAAALQVQRILDDIYERNHGVVLAARGVRGDLHGAWTEVTSFLAWWWFVTMALFRTRIEIWISILMNSDDKATFWPDPKFLLQRRTVITSLNQSQTIYAMLIHIAAFKQGRLGPEVTVRIFISAHFASNWTKHVGEMHFLLLVYLSTKVRFYDSEL